MTTSVLAPACVINGEQSIDDNREHWKSTEKLWEHIQLFYAVHARTLIGAYSISAGV